MDMDSNSYETKRNGIVLGSELSFSIDGLKGIAKTSLGIEFFYIGLTLITKYDDAYLKDEVYEKVVGLWIYSRDCVRQLNTPNEPFRTI